MIAKVHMHCTCVNVNVNVSNNKLADYSICMYGGRRPYVSPRQGVTDFQDGVLKLEATREFTHSSPINRCPQAGQKVTDRSPALPCIWRPRCSRVTRRSGTRLRHLPGSDGARRLGGRRSGRCESFMARRAAISVHGYLSKQVGFA